MANEAQKEVWNVSEVPSTWEKAEHFTDQGTAPLMQALQLRTGERVLDVACGGGKTTLAAAKIVGSTGHVTGVDISSGMLELSRSRLAASGLENVELVLCDAQVDDFPSGPYGVVMSQFGIMFFDDPSAAMTNIRRQLEPGGRAAFIAWQPETRMAWCPALIIAKYLPPREQEAAAATVERAGSWGDASFATDVMTSAGFIEVRVAECNIDAELPAEADLPASLLTGMVDPSHRETVLAEWQAQRTQRISGGVLRLDLRMNLITGRVPAQSRQPLAN